MTEKEYVPKKFELKLKDFFLSNEDFALYKNEDFGFLETWPRPLENLGKYYESEDYISHTDSRGSWFEKIYRLIQTYNIRYKFSKLKDPKPGQKILDYGCGTGDFLLYAQNKNLTVYGIEPNESALGITRKKIGKENASDKPIGDLKESFDIITLWHVLEHIPDLFSFIEELKSKLNHKGQILIAVPNYRSYDGRFYKEYWAAYDVPRHLWHFSPESLEKLFNSFGMKIEKKYPLWFDSYYVSILSEKYKKSPMGFIRATFVASFSNFFGIFNGNYSSVIYRIIKNEN